MKMVLAVIGVIAAVISLLLIIPLEAKLRITNGETFLSVRYLFFKKTLLPQKIKADEKEKETADKSATYAKAGSKSAKKPSAKELLPIVFDALPKCFGPVKKLLKRTTAADVEIYMVIVGEDAADTAVKFGRMNALVFPALSMAAEIVTLKCKSAELVPGFAANEEYTDFSSKIRLTPLTALIAAANIAIIVLGAFMKAEKNKPVERKSQNGKEQPAHQ